MGDVAKQQQIDESGDSDAAIRFVHFAGADRIELAATIVLSIAAILTAWSLFQGGKWSGVESFQLAEASATRTESVRADNTANELALADITMFDNWLLAVQEDIDAGHIQPDEPLNAHPEAISTFFYRHMREEFRPAVDAWLATDPLHDTGDGSTASLPYEMDEYELAAREEALRLAEAADAKVDEARRSNETSDSYVFTAVLFATVLFFAGVSGKMTSQRNRLIMLGMGIVILISTAVYLVSLPIEI